jgi:peptide-N4-(N-acetyl-beta-glucosaminyl)asparagine amidase
MDPEEIKRIASRLGRLWTERCNQPQPSGQQQFLQQIRHHAEHVRRYDDWELQEKCRSVIPIDRLHKEAREEMHKHNGLDFEDVVVKRLLQWFKHEFFQWVNQPKCSKCSSVFIPV